MDTTAKVIELGAEWVDKDARREHLKEVIKAAEGELKAIDAELKAVVGEGNIGRLATGVDFKIEVIVRAAYSVAEGVYTKIQRKLVKLVG